MVAVVAVSLFAGLGVGRRAGGQDKPEAEKREVEKPPLRGVPGIFAMDPDGSNPRPLVKIPGMRWHGSPSWSRDGAMVAFDATGGGFSESQVFVYAVKGPFKGMLRDMGPGLYPTFSPDDATIAYGGPGNPNGPQSGEPGVWLMNADGTNRRWLCNGDHPKWSPDGKKIAIAHDQQTPGTIDVVTLETGKAVRVLTSTYAEIHGAVFSPDGGKLAFIGYADPQRLAAELVVMGADGAPETRQVVTRGRIGWVPNWSPDGKQLTFVLWTRKLGVDIDTSYVVDADGKGVPVKLKNQDVGTRNVEVEWSPDGKALVFASDREIDGVVKIEQAEEQKVDIVPRQAE